MKNREQSEYANHYLAKGAPLGGVVYKLSDTVEDASKKRRFLVSAASSKSLNKRTIEIGHESNYQINLRISDHNHKSSNKKKFSPDLI